MKQWEVQQLRLTVFPSSALELDPAQLWMEMVGEEPDSLNVRPKQNHVLINGDFNLGVLSFELLPDRINWIYQIPASISADSVSLSLGTLDSALSVFDKIVDKWFGIASCPKVNRIALGAILEIPTDTRIEGYNTLLQYLPFMNLNENSSDFSYQINRLRTINIVGRELKVNRISKWGVSATVESKLVFNPNSIRTVSSNIKPRACRLELDVNTVETFDGEFDCVEQRSVFLELQHQAYEIAEKGDTP